MIAYSTAIETYAKPHRCECRGCEYVMVRERVEVLPDLSRMSRHDRRTVEAIARKYGIEIGNQVQR